MKTMTCQQLGGACDKVFQANTFEEMAEQSKQHGIQMFQEGDTAHLKVITEMQVLMQNPQEMMKWFEDKRQEFDALADD
jgi:hypothetical protein